MPWKSISQMKWGNSPAGIRALGGKKNVEEWNRATGNKKLPQRVKKGK